MYIVVAGSSCHGLKSVEEQVSGDINDVVQASKPYLIASGVALDLLQMTKRVDPQYEAAKYEDLSGEKNSTLDGVVVDD